MAQQGRGRPKKEFDVVDSVTGPEKTLDEVGIHEPIEQVTENDFVKAADLEKFMNEPVKIMVHSTMLEGEMEILCPNVNGINQPVVRDTPQVIKRKYVEVLARSLTTKPKQRLRDLNDPSSLVTYGMSKPSYPFTVLEDKNPNGRPWLKSIVDSAMAEATR